jgi:phage tail-like protein
MAENFEIRLNIEGPNAPNGMLLPLGEIIIGRQPGSDLLLADNLVSRSHARLVRSEGGCLLIDLGSANKTFVNDNKLEPQVATPIAPGDTIRIGPYQLRLEIIPLPDVLAELAPTPMIELPPELAGMGEEKGDGNGKAEEFPPLPLPPPAAPQHVSFSPVPLGLTVESQRLINYLPDIYDTDFMKRFLGIFESIQVPIEWVIDNFDLYLNPATAPKDFLPWLENWFQLSQGSDWALEQRRTFLQEAHKIFAWRGTRWALSRVLEIYTGVTPEIDDSSEKLEPFTFLVRIPATRQPLKRAQIEALIEANKPAYTTFILEGL